MRLILTFVAVLFLATFAWGWFNDVYHGSMDTKSYAEYYWRNMNRQISRTMTEAGKAVENLKRPMPARKEFQI